MPTKSVKLNVLTSGVDRAMSDMEKLSASKTDLGKGATIRLTLQDSDLTAEKLDALKLSVKDLSDKGANIFIKLEGAGTAEAELAGLKADSEALSLSGAKVSGSLKNAGEEAEGFGSKMKIALGGALGIGALGGLVVGLGLSTKVALDAQSAVAALGNAIHDAGGNVKNYESSISDTEDAMAKFGFTGSQVDEGLTQLIHATGSVTISEGAMGVAADLAASRHVSLTAATQMLARAAGGTMKGMKDLGITQVTGATQAKAMGAAQSALSEQIDNAGGMAQFAAAHNLSLAKATQLVTEAQGTSSAAMSEIAGKGLTLASLTTKITEAQGGDAKAVKELAAAHLTLGGAEDLVSNATSGNVKALNELGIVVLPKTATAAFRLSQIQTVLNEKLGGSAATQAATFQGKMDALKAEFTNIAERIGLAVLPALSSLLSVFVKIAGCKPAVMVLTVALGLLAISFIGVKVAALLAGDGMKTALISSGVGLLILAISVGIIELMQHWRGLETGVKEVWQDIQNVTMGVVDWFKSHWPLLIAILTGPIGIAALVIIKYFHDIESGVLGVWSHIWSAIVSPVVNAFDAVKNAITGGFDGWWKSHGAEVEDVWKAIWDACKTVFLSFWNPIDSAAKIGFSVLTTIFSAGSHVVMDILSYLKMVWQGTWAFILADIKIAWAEIDTVIKIGTSLITTICKAAMDFIVTMFKVEWEIAKGVVIAVFDEIRAVLKAAWDLIVGIFNVALDLITGHWSLAWHDMLNTGKQMWSAIDQGVSAVWHDIESTTTSVFSNIMRFFSNFWSYTRQGFRQVVTDVTSLWRAIESAVKTPIQWIASNVWNKFAGVVDAVTKFLSLGSPIPTLSLSSGGRIPGYGGGDVLPALLERGETVVSKETSPKLASVFASAGVPGYQLGGIIGDITNTVGSVAKSAWGGIKDVGSFAKSLVMGGVEALAKPVLEGMVSAMGSMPGASSGLGSVLEAIPKYLVSHLLSWMKGEDAATGSGSSIVSYAESFIGKVPYVWGGTSPSGWDCSGFTSYVYDHFGYHPPRTSEAQFGWVKQTPTAIPGGLAFFAGSDGTVASPGHVGIIVNSNKMVDAYGTGYGTRYNTIVGSSGGISGYGVPPTGFSAGASGGVNSPGSMTANAIAALWVAQGGPAYAAQNMARIASVESADVPGVIQKGQPPGLTGYGLYQITPTSGIWQNGKFGNLLNAANNTKAAIYLFNAAGGYGPWTSDPVGSSLVAGGLSYGAGGVIGELVKGIGASSGRSYTFGESGRELVTPMSGRAGIASGGGDTVNINIGVATDPNATAQAIHQMLRRYKTKKGGAPLGLD